MLANDNSTISDDVLRTIQERHPQLLIPLFNEVFHTSYPENARVGRLPEEYQSTKDGKMVLRMVEYDFMIALTGAEKQDGSYHLKMPRSCVLYLRGDELLLEYQEIIEQLDAAEEMKREGLMQDMIRLIRRIADYQLCRERELRERMDKVMGGKVLELPSDKLREERAQGIEQGITQGIAQGIKALVEVCREFGTSREDTEERIKTKFKLTNGRAQEYMQEYWR